MNILQSQELIDDDGQPLIKPKSAGRSGSLPKLLRLNSFEEEVNHTIATIEQLNSDGIALNEIGVFCSSKAMSMEICSKSKVKNIPFEWLNKDPESRNYNPCQESFKLMTLQTCKGLEFEAVIIPGLQYISERHNEIAECVRVIYVGMTRSTHRLIMSYSRESILTQKLQTIFDEKTDKLRMLKS